MEKITFNNINHELLIDFFKISTIKSSITVEISDKNIAVKAYPLSKSFIKYKNINFSDLWELTSGNIGGRILEIPMMATNVTEVYDAIRLFGEELSSLTLYVNENLVGKIELKTKKKKYSITSSDPSNISPAIPDKVWNSFADDDESYLKMNLSRETIREILKLSMLQRETKEKPIAIVQREDGLYATNEFDESSEIFNRWEHKFADDNIKMNDMKIDDPRIFSPTSLSLITGENNNIFIKDHPTAKDKCIMLVEENENSKLVCLTTKRL